VSVWRRVLEFWTVALENRLKVTVSLELGLRSPVTVAMSSMELPTVAEDG
jgi:hypothetical protein